MDKYKHLLLEKLTKQFQFWFDSARVHEVITNHDVYLFLHSIKGTAGTVGLGGLFTVSSKLLQEFGTYSPDKEWSKQELQEKLAELMGLSEQVEQFVLDEVPSLNERNEQTALIQVIDEDVSTLIYLKDALEAEGFMVLGHTDYQQAAETFYDVTPDILVIDLNPSKQSGFMMLTELGSHLANKFTPVLMMSESDERKWQLTAYELGVDFFLHKPLEMDEFLLHVRRLMKRKSLFDHNALMDELTQVYNRRFLRDMLVKSLTDIERAQSYFTLAILDIDHFKAINDTYGHVFGDDILRSFAQFLQEQTRATDTVYRFGGEEFIILFPRTKDAEVVAVLQRILQSFKNQTFQPEKRDEWVTVSFSAGVFTVYQSDLDSETVIKTADRALYHAKENGRSTVVSANQLELAVAKKTLYVSVIDDDQVIRSIVLKMLASMEFAHVSLDLAEFENGERFFASERADLHGQHFVIVDGVMPIIDGTEVLQRLKGGRKRHLFHVLMLTGRKNEREISRAFRLGAEDYVTKPFSIQELEARIYRLIQRIIK